MAAATRLADTDAEALLARLSAIAARPGDKKDFALRPGSAPPPRTGKTISGTFPPPPGKLAPPPGDEAHKPLAVLRYSPEGEVPVAPQLAVTFSQPMVAVTSHADLAGTSPVKLTPTPPGKWRWIGTRTVVFDPEIRFPQATNYRVEVPRGTRSAAGAALGEAVAFEFVTPPPTLVTQWPHDGNPQRRDVGMFLLFDQKIEVASMLPFIAVEAEGKRVAVRPLDAAELAKDEHLARLVDAAKANEQEGRWIAVRASELLPGDAGISVRVLPGAPSAEGPNKTVAPQGFGFRTYAPLRLTDAECGWRGRCPPGTPFILEFNNPLDDERFTDDLIQVSPEIPGLKVQASYHRIVVSGATKAHRTYQVTVGAGLADRFEQRLGKEETRSFTVGPAEPSFFGPSGMVVADPAAKRPSLDVFTTNHEALKVKLYQVEPDDVGAFALALRNLWNEKNPPRIPGRLLFDRTVATAPGKDELVETHVDLSSALPASGLGHVIAIVEPSPWKPEWAPPRLHSWIQVTRLAVDAHVDGEELVAFVTSLDDGKPLAGVTVEMRPGGSKAVTSGDGIVRLPLPQNRPSGVTLLVATRGDDVAVVTDDSSWWGGSSNWTRRVASDELAWYVADDRQMYRPGEEVHLKGWLRLIGRGKGGDVGGLDGQVAQVAYKLRDSQGNEIASGSSPVNVAGGWDAAFKLPTTPNLGHASLELVARGQKVSTHYHSIQIQEFRRPEFEVSTTASDGPHLVGGSADVTVSAKYYAGGGLAGSPVHWQVSSSPTGYTPPNRDDFVFGEWRPWWNYRGWGDDDGSGGSKSESHQGTTDAVGDHVLHLDFLSVNPPAPMSVAAQASVTDVNQQTWASTQALLVHPSTHYVGLRAARPFVEKGTDLEVQAIDVDLDGKAVMGRTIAARAVRLDWKLEKGKYVKKELDPQTCTLTSAAEPGLCKFKTSVGGTYEVEATVTDERGRPNRSKLTLWVSGGEVPPSRDLQQETVNLIPDKKEYQPGDTAELLVQAPFFPAEGIVSWRRSGILKTERISLAQATTIIKVPIADAHIPNLHVQVDLVGKAARTDDNGKADPALPPRPAYAVGTLSLAVPPRSRTLAVEVSPRAAKVSPGQTTELDVVVKDAHGRPVGAAEVAVIVVDEAVLALSGHSFASPVDTFYRQRESGVSDHYLRGYVKLARPSIDELAAATGSAEAEGGRALPASAPPAPPGAPRRKNLAAPKEGKLERAMMADEKDSGASSSPGPAIAVRSNFDPLATFAPEVKTGGDGRAVVRVKVPDNLTRYRIVALVAAGARQFGKGESALTARLPLMVRPSPPRFLNFGDVFSLPVVVQNQTDAAMTVQVAVRATNAALTDGNGRTVVVPANDRALVMFPAAAEMAGTARFQLAAASGNASDAAEVALPVWTPATTEAFATYGVIDDGAVRQPIAMPSGVVRQFGGLEVQTSSTQLQALTDAVLYLVSYPFDCAEQRASRVLTLVALRDVLDAFAVTAMPTKSQLEMRIADDLEHLENLQNHDGGFPFWQRGRASWPYLTVHVANALTRARSKGYAVDGGMLARAQEYLRTIERHYPAEYPVEIRRTISSYALYVRRLLGDLDVAKAQTLIADAGGVTRLSMEGNGWLLGTLAGQVSAAGERRAILRHLGNQVAETAGAANFTTGYSDGGHLILSSDRRVDGVILESLIQEARNDDLIPKLVTGLLAHRKAGRWNNTQDNAFVLLALDLYFRTYEKVTPDFVARLWLGGDHAGDHRFVGRQTDRFAIDIPMAWVADHPGDLTIQKDGKGRLYYRVGMTYAPADLKLPPADHGFVVTRRYEAVDDPGDVSQRSDGTWKIKLGSRVRVRLSMVAENRRYHVALVDPLPAGLEAMNPALAVTGDVPPPPAASEEKSAHRRWWWGPWFEHQNLRDERVEAFTTLLWSGVHEYTYVARATTPGQFVVPPTKAEEMYMPETFGRAAGDRVNVE
jgi:uncharacterized protein YfaS (alpha-2-macroglobulin family)